MEDYHNVGFTFAFYEANNKNELLKRVYYMLLSYVKMNVITIDYTCVSFQYMWSLYPWRISGDWLMCLMASLTAGITPLPIFPSAVPGVIGKNAAK